MEGLNREDSKKAFAALKLGDYLLSHESDIASGVNDYGELREVFTVIHHRVPEEK